MATHTLRLPATCATPGDDRQACADCLRQRLAHTPGIRQLDFSCDPDESIATIALDYDPQLLPLNELDAEVRKAGLCLSSTRAQVIVGIDGMISPRSEQQIESALARLPGVVASASYASRSLRIEFDRTQCALPEIAMRLGEIGFRLREYRHNRAPDASETPSHEATARSAWRAKLAEYHKLIMAIVGGLLLIGAVINNIADGPETLRYVLVALSFVIAGWYTAIDTFQILRQFRFDIDVLMFAAAFGAALLGHYEEGAFLLVLFALGGAGEELAMDKARHAIEALAKLAPDTATVRDPDGRERLVRVEHLGIGDQIVIKPFDRVPSDAQVVSGTSAIDQSPITGESVPVEKSPGSGIFAGTINGDGLLVAAVTKTSDDSTLAKIVKLVNEAQTTKSPTQVFTDKVERWYVPFVLIGTLMLLVLPPLLGLPHRQLDKGPWAGWFYQAMAFLTAASPCALAIGTPAAVLSGIARAARIGVLVKGGVHLENLGRVNVVAFDKTGTLTRGRPVVTDVHALDGVANEQVLALAAAVEMASSHPLAAAIVGEARRRGLSFATATDAQQEPGRGVRGTVDGRVIEAGRVDALMNGNGHAAVLARFDSDGKTTVAVTRDGQPIGVIALSDRPRENAAETIARLKRMGIRRTIMLTGDKRAVADRIATALGIDETHAEMMPEDKLRLVGELQEKHGAIAMVGDGVNDAPALATAAVGIAMGGAGTDVALETADVALMADDLTRLPDAIGLSRFSRRIIAQNLFIALGTIALLAPLAALGYAMLGIAVLFHEGSTVVVVLNSLRLLVYRPR